MSFESIGWIAEIDRSRAVADEIVWIVEAPSFKEVGEHGLRAAVCLETDDPTASTLAQQEAPLEVNGQTI